MIVAFADSERGDNLRPGSINVLLFWSVEMESRWDPPCDRFFSHKWRSLVEGLKSSGAESAE